MEPVNIVMTQLREIARGTIEMVPQFAVALIVIILTWIVSAIVGAVMSRVLSRAKLRVSLKELFHLLASLVVWILGLMVAAIILFPGLTPASMLAGLGIGSVAIGFAFKDIFENFLAGIIILFRREMRMGDFIECEGIEGEVRQIAIRESHIRQTDGQLVIVPNSILFKNPVTIRTEEDLRRTTIMCGVAYDEDVARAREVIRDAVTACETVRHDDRPVQIFAQAFGASSIDFEVTWWTGAKPVDIRTSRDEVVEAVKRALDEAGIEIPFPYRTLTFKEPLSVVTQPDG